MMRHSRTVALAVAGVTGALAPAAEGRTLSTYVQVRVYSPTAVDAHVGWMPLSLFPPRDRVRFTADGTSYIGTWANAVIAGGTTSDALKLMGRRYSYGTEQVVVTDRRLTARERKRFTVRTRLFRDADVLVVSADHPVCATGLSLTQARAIATGRIRQWAEVVTGATTDTIAVRYRVNAVKAAELRFGTRLMPYRTTRGIRYRTTYAASARGLTDAGVGAAARGDHAIAAVTSWSHVGRLRSPICVVPLGGVRAGHDTVASLRFPGAYSVDLVAARRLKNGYVRKLVALFVARMGSAKAKDQLRARGLLVAGDPVPAGTPGTPSGPPASPTPEPTPESPPA